MCLSILHSLVAPVKFLEPRHAEQGNQSIPSEFLIANDESHIDWLVDSQNCQDLGETRLKDEEDLRSSGEQEALGCQHCVAVAVTHIPGGMAATSRVNWSSPASA